MSLGAIIAIYISCCFGPFAGIFFGSLATDNISWWAFCFLGQVWPFFSLVHKTVITPDGGGDASIVSYNTFGGTTWWTTYLSYFESVELVKGCFGRLALKITYTDEGYEKLRTAMGCCKCCIKKVFTEDGIACAPVLKILGLDSPS